MPKIPILGNALPNEKEEEDVPLNVEEYFAGKSALPTVDERFRKEAAGVNMEFDFD